MSKSPLPQHRLVSVSEVEVQASASASVSPQGAICILGMHRSGTSLVTGLLRMCGVALGPMDKMMQPKPDNPSGFWEHLDIHEINEQLLARLGGSWDEPQVLTPGWESSAELESYYQRARQVVARDFHATSSWAFKDPRTALLLPFWRKVVANPHFVICVRNPLDVARSLRRRNGLPVAKGTRLWTLYMTAALFHTRDAARIITMPENLLRHGREELAQWQGFLGISPVDIEQACSELDTFIDAARWHHQSDAGALYRSQEADPASKLLYSALLQTTNRWRAPGSAAKLGLSDHLDILSQQVWGDLSRDEAKKRLQAELDERRKQVEQIRVQKDAELEALKLRQEELRQLGEERAAQLQRSQASLARTRERLFEHMTLSANLESRLEERKADVDRQGLEVARLLSNLEDVRARLQAVTSSLGWQLLNRYRDLRQRVFALGRLPERIYRRLTSAWRHQLSPATALLPGTQRPEDLTTPPEPTSVKELARPVTLKPRRVDPPQSWSGDSKRPPVVIIVPSWNRVGYLRQCLNSILEETDYPYYRVCIFDQGSTDGSRELLESLSGASDRVETILSVENLGFVHANNVALETFPKWDVVFLNNDTRVTRGWLTNLVTTAYSAELIGLVGAKLVYPDGRLQEAGSEIFRNGSARAYGKFEDPADPRFNQTREVDYCSASCLYVKREVVAQCGGFEECYSPCYYEDADLAFKARAAGYMVLYEPRSTIVHQEYGTTGKSSAFSWMQRNQEKFVERWASVLENHPRSLWSAPASNPRSNARQQILVLGDIVPAPDRSAGGSRLYYLLRILAKEYDVTYAFLKDQMIREYVRPLERIGVSTFYPGFARSVGSNELDIRSILESNDFRFVICSLYTVGAQFLGLIRQESPQSFVLIDTYDVHFLRERRQAELEGDERLLRRAQETQEVELATYARADAVITVTEQDRAALREHQPDLNVTLIPTLHELPERLTPREERRGLLFVGGFSHAPNKDAVLYFCREILPLLRKRIPEIELKIVGNAPTPEILALNGNGVAVTGYVPNLRPYLESCLVSVAPIRFGSGMKGKIAEAMAYGLPVVTTPIGAEGMSLESGRDVMVGESTADFVDQIVALHKDEELWNRIAENAFTRVLESWRPKAVESQVLEFFRRAGQASS